MSRASSILSHSSSTKCFMFSGFKCLPLTKARMRPGVPTKIVGGELFSALMCSWIGWPPYMTYTDTFLVSRYFVNRSYSFLIWKANSLVWHMTRVEMGFGSSSS